MKYFKNLIYIIQHKYYVLIECWKVGLYWQGLTHDISKFNLQEFRPYAWKFFSGVSNEDQGRYEDFMYAWLHHLHKNKYPSLHHRNHR